MMWTEDQDKQLIDMWQNGAIGLEIAKALGKTRGSIMGRINRLRQAGVYLRERPRVKSENSRDARRAKERELKKLNAVVRKPKPRALIKQDEAPIDSKPIVIDFSMSEDDESYRAPCDIMELRFFSCRYIVSENPTMYCNRIIHKHSYCEGHFRLCYQVGTNVPLAAKPRPAYRNAQR